MNKIAIAGIALLPAFALAAEPLVSEGTARTSSEPIATVLSGYRLFKDEPVASWRQVNDNVGKIGGWKVYAKEQSATSTPARDPHGAHGGAK